MKDNQGKELISEEVYWAQNYNEQYTAAIKAPKQADIMEVELSCKVPGIDYMTFDNFTIYTVKMIGNPIFRENFNSPSSLDNWEVESGKVELTPRYSQGEDKMLHLQMTKGLAMMWNYAIQSKLKENQVYRLTSDMALGNKTSSSGFNQLNVILRGHIGSSMLYDFNAGFHIDNRSTIPSFNLTPYEKYVYIPKGVDVSQLSITGIDGYADDITISD